MHRVVVTGLGCVTPVGLNATSSFQNLLSGLNGIRNILSLPDWQHLHAEIRQMSSHLAAPVLQIPPKTSSIKLPRSFIFAEMAAKEALKDSNYQNYENVGVFFGCGMPGVNEIYENSQSISNGVR
jgi:3-oxoacyl-(acyl-carrier-protein) synthase